MVELGFDPKVVCLPGVWSLPLGPGSLGEMRGASESAQSTQSNDGAVYELCIAALQITLRLAT